MFQVWRDGIMIHQTNHKWIAEAIRELCGGSIVGIAGQLKWEVAKVKFCKPLFLKDDPRLQKV